MSVFVAIIKTDNPKQPTERVCFAAFDMVQFIWRVHNYASSNYYTWDIIKKWRLS